MRVAFTVILAAPVFAAGCTEPAGPRTVKSDDLTIKIPAIKQAAKSQDTSAVPQLVKDLDSDDPAVRMYAILGLQEITGEDFGYVYYADRETRKPAVTKWRQWLERRRQEQAGAAAGKKDQQ